MFHPFALRDAIKKLAQREDVFTMAASTYWNGSPFGVC